MEQLEQGVGKRVVGVEPSRLKMRSKDINIFQWSGRCGRSIVIDVKIQVWREHPALAERAEVVGQLVRVWDAADVDEARGMCGEVEVRVGRAEVRDSRVRTALQRVEQPGGRVGLAVVGVEDDEEGGPGGEESEQLG